MFPAYDHLTCWEDEIHGGTGPTLAGTDTSSIAVQPAEEEEEGRWSAKDVAAGRPLAAQRRRLSEGAAAGSKKEEAQEEARGQYLFDWEKKPAKLLAFVSAE